MAKYEEEGKEGRLLTARRLRDHRAKISQGRFFQSGSANREPIVTVPLAKEQTEEVRGPVIPKKPDEDLKVSLIPGEEPHKVIPPKTEPRVEAKPEEEKRIAALPSTPQVPEEKEKPKRGALPEPGPEKLVDIGQPIDITSDSVETLLEGEFDPLQRECHGPPEGYGHLCRFFRGRDH